MSYQVLARKYRPKNFAQVVGQQHILTALSNGLKNNRLHHAYLFSGTRGVGKTSIARLFAKGLNCEKGVTAEPCGECEHCQAIEAGRFIDLIEIDAASRTKVEDTRELLDNVQYKPAQGRYKVYLIDEVHMLSRHSFNALLKTLEEPPEYVKFLLATTDPQKLPITILSRCMQFHLKALQEQEIATHLQNVLQQEHIPFDPPALARLAHFARGSIRDSLSLADQAIALGGGQVSFQCVKEMLGLIDETYPITILTALQQGNGEQLMQALALCAEKGCDWSRLLEMLVEYLHHIALLQFLPQKERDKNHSLAFLAQHIAPQDVQFYYQILLQGREELQHMSNQRLACEMVLLRALAFHPKFNENMLPNVEKSIQKSGRESTASQQGQGIISESISLSSSPASMDVVLPSSKKNIDNPPQEDSVHSQALEGLAILEQLACEKKNPSHITLETENRTHFADKQGKVETKIGALSAPASSTTEVGSYTENIAPSLEKEDEDYRWEWINPELMQVPNVSLSPSRIQQTLEKNNSPQLQQQLISQAMARDPWRKCIEEMQLSGLLREMALNCAKIAETASSITLAQEAKDVHLQTNYASPLQEALSNFYQKPIQLIFVEKTPTQLTPKEQYEKLYLERCQQTKRDLALDPKLAQIIQMFDATLDENSICPV